MDLRTRYTALVTFTTQHVKYISDALRRLEEEEVLLWLVLLLLHFKMGEMSDRYLGMFWLFTERGGGGEAGQSGPSFRPAGLGQRPPATISGPQC